MTLTGEVTGDSTHDSWGPSRPEGKAIGLYAHIEGNSMTFSLGFFGSLDPTGDCFPGGVTPPLFAALIKSKNIKGRITQAIAGFWFDGFNSGGDPVNYVLHMFGTFSDAATWPSDNTLTMTDWEMSDASGDGEAAQTACLGEGPFDDPGTGMVVENVTIDVQAHSESE